MSNYALKELLTAVGLKEKEAIVYLASLEIGTNPASTIAKRAEINRCTVYAILDSLTRKGFITQFDKGDIRYYSPIEPKRILNYLEHKKLEIEEQIEDIYYALTKFDKIKNPYVSKPKVTFYEGENGIINVYEDILSSKKPVFSYISRTSTNPKLSSFLQKYNKTQKRNGIQKRSISFNQKNTKENLTSQLEITIYGNKMAIISFSENFAVLIKSKEISTAQKKIFKLVWDKTHNKLHKNN